MSIQMVGETKLCVCGKKMIVRDSGFVLTIHPPVIGKEWICYGCNAIEQHPGMRQVDLDKQRWEAANQ